MVRRAVGREHTARTPTGDFTRSRGKVSWLSIMSGYIGSKHCYLLAFKLHLIQNMSGNLSDSFMYWHNSNRINYRSQS